MKKLVYGAFLLAVPHLFLAGCGNNLSGGSTASVTTPSQGCITASCHGTMASRVTGRSIADEWRASSHAAANVAGCTTCHGHSHQNSCGSCHGGAVPLDMAQNSLDAEGRCLDCHVIGPDLMKGLDDRHLPELDPNFAKSTDNAAGWVILRGTAYESKCIWCHNPHDNRVLPQHEQWVESGHGSIASGYLRVDFKTRGASGDDRTQVPGTSCVRCHSTTGFVNWVESGLADVSSWGANIQFTNRSTAKMKQTLYCNVCHDNGSGKAYGFNLRPIPAQGVNGALRVWLNYSAASGTLSVPKPGQEVVPVVTASDVNKTEQFSRLKVLNNSVDYPKAGVSDRCILCHSGRASGQLIKQVAESSDVSGVPFNFRRNNRLGTHDFAGAGNVFRTLGFEYYPADSYSPPANIPYVHDQIGRMNFMDTGSRGPCVTCHMSSAEAHLWEPVSKDEDDAITSIKTALCSRCHGSGGIGFSRFNGSVAALNEKKEGYAAALKAMIAWSNMKGISSTSNWLRQSTYPLPDSVAEPAAVQDLLRAEGAVLAANGLNQSACVPPADRSRDAYLGMRNMGVGLNRDLLSHDPGGYVHNDLYVKQLIYDSLDWADNCVMDKSVEKAIRLTQDDRADNAVLFLLTSWSNNVARTTDNRLSADEVTSAVNYLMGAPGGGRPGGQ